MSTFSGRIKEALESAGLTQAEVSRLSGVSEAAISRWMKGVRTNPSVEELANVAKALNVSLSWLWEGIGPRNRAVTGDPELLYEWPSETPEAVRIAVVQEVLEERDAHRRALVPYWHERTRAVLDRRQRRG